MRIKFLKFECEVTESETNKMFEEYVKNGGENNYEKYIYELPTKLIEKSFEKIYSLFLRNFYFLSILILSLSMLLRSILSFYTGVGNDLLLPLLDTFIVFTILILSIFSILYGTVKIVFFIIKLIKCVRTYWKEC